MILFRNSILEYELWRYLTYSLGDTELTMTWSTSLLVSVHRAALHLVCVLSVQLTIGVMMETVHGGAGRGIIRIIRPVSDVRRGLYSWYTLLTKSELFSFNFRKF